MQEKKWEWQNYKANAITKAQKHPYLARNSDRQWIFPGIRPFLWRKWRKRCCFVEKRAPFLSPQHVAHNIRQLRLESCKNILAPGRQRTAKIQRKALIAPGSHWDDPSEASSGATCCPLASWTSPPAAIFSGLSRRLNGSMTQKIEADEHQQIILIISMWIYLWSSNQDLHLVDYIDFLRQWPPLTWSVALPVASALTGTEMLNLVIWSTCGQYYVIYIYIIYIHIIFILYIYMGSISMCQYCQCTNSPLFFSTSEKTKWFHSTSRH